MENHFQRSSGFCLIVGSFLLIVTMVLHPSGGSIEHILKIRDVIVVSHSLAIFSLPFVGFGFYGLSMSLLTSSKISLLSFFIAVLGLIAAMLAATINGLTLPLFVSAYSGEVEQNLDVLKPILRYGFSINKPMDYIFIAASCLSMGIWSVLIIRDATFPRWTGYYGLLLLVLGVAGVVVRFNFIDLFGFRVFVFGLVSWVVSMGVFLIREK